MIIFMMVFQFTLYSFSPMSLRRTAVLNAFVKMLIMKYTHICSYFLSVVGIGIRAHPHVSRLSDSTLNIRELVRLAEVSGLVLDLNQLYL